MTRVVLDQPPHRQPLVGENGSGKTTLAKLIAGMYRPTTGSIDWDGVDVAQLSPDSVTDRVVLVPQDAVRWPHTARANVRVGRHDRDDPDDQALWTAARLARADEVVEDLPQGWETVLSKHFQGGRELSGGVRVAARARGRANGGADYPPTGQRPPRGLDLRAAQGKGGGAGITCGVGQRRRPVRRAVFVAGADVRL